MLKLPRDGRWELKQPVTVANDDAAAGIDTYAEITDVKQIRAALAHILPSLADGETELGCVTSFRRMRAPRSRRAAPLPPLPSHPQGTAGA